MHSVTEDIREQKTNILALYPLSPIQGGFLFQSLYEKSSDIYFTQMLLELTGKLQIDALKQAWIKLLARHESLRASFMWDDLEEPIQIIHKKVDITWHEEDWYGLSAEAQKKQLDAYIAKDRAQGFDFTQAPLMRWGLFKYDNDKHYLLWSHHHILSDGWSGPIILDEVRSVYDSLVNGKEISLPNRRPYGDYIAWLSRQDQKKAEDYWKEVLAGVLPTKLVSRDTKEDQTHAYGECMFSLSEENSHELLTYASRLGVTPNTVLQTLWGIVLSVYTGQSDIVFGVTVSGRQIDLPAIESMVGMFINTLPLRIQLRGSDSLEEVIRATQNQMIGMQEHAYIPLWKIQAQQREGGSGLFDSTYTYQNYPIQRDVGKSSGLGINLSKSIEKMEYKLGITLFHENCLRARIEYQEKSFTKDFIKQMLAHFEQLILSVINNPSQKVGELSLLRAEELKQLAFWNETQHEYPKEKGIHQLFEESTESIPDAIAVVYEDQQISYRALNERANQLAHYLRGLGVEAEVPVVLAIGRSIEMVIGILGILKAGGTYVPLEVNYPQERLEYMLEDSGAPFIVSRRVELEKLPIGHQIVIDLDEVRESLEEQPKTLPKHGLFLENLVYIIYTSGSTGKPKGVAVTHTSAVAYLSWAKTIYGVNNNKPILFHSSICFDMSVTSLFIPLLTGKLIRIIKEDFSNMIEGRDQKETFSFIKLTPSHLRLVKENSHYELDYLSDCFVVGGEEFKGEDLTNRNLTIFNEYGPTEATVACSVYEINKSKEYQTIPIGRPIWNTQMYILDTHLNLVPIGVEGEIYIGGVGLARGYLNQPGLTAERFISNPFEAGSRLYRTGDLGRYLTDGNIEFVGRIDHQVKLRGFRIELGEIEGTIEVAEAVQQAVVLCREDMPGQKRLVAYVVPKNKEDSSLVESLQNLCQNRLPDYMQPSQWVVLESLPLTPNGKIDRKGLPIPEGREGVGGYQAPEGLIEERLAQVWSELLGMEIGRRDDFFRLGGHSLLATQMVSRLREVLRLEVPLKAVFEHSVLFELARYIEHSHLQEGILPSIARVSRDKPQALSFAQQRLWFLEQLLPNTGLYHNPMSFRILGKLNIEVLRQALDAIVARHEILRTVIINSKGIALQRVLSEDTKFDLRESTENTEALIEEFIKKPFQFDSEPLCRGLLLKYSEQEHVLLLVFHHIVVDDWSMGIFYKELNAFYKTYSENKILALPPLPVQYIDYSVWQRSWLQGEVLEKQLSYWQEQLREVARLELPTDYPRPKELSYQGGFVYRKLPKELLNQLQEFSQIQGVTLFMSLLASIQGFLSRYCNQTDIAIGTPIASRRSTEVEGLIGFFVNTLVLRSQFKDNPSFETLIKQVENSTISAYEHQDVPFEQLVEYLQVSRELNRNPLFQVMFTLHPGGEKFQLGDLEVLTEEPPEYLSRFDLLINAFVDQEGLYMKFDYAKELFTGERIERLADYYETFLRAILREPSKRLSEIPLLGEQELQQLFLWNETQHEYPREKGIHQLFEETVERVPDAIAVVYEDQQISYRALNERANQLAHYLRKRGVGPDQLVAIAIERSLEMVVSLLGILKAGGAYVPIDPSYPEERLIFMLEDTRTPLLISQDSLREVFEGYNKIIFIDEIWQEIEQESKDNPQTLTLPQHLAYIIYTSGSTGKPKGVMVQHEEVVSFCFKNNYLIIDSNTITLSFSNYVFDGSVFDIFSTLLNSGRLIIASKDDILNAQKLEQLIVAYSVNVSFITTALFANYAKLKEKNPLLHVYNLLFGGEKINYEDLEIFLKKNNNTSNLIHVYGPTENIVFSTYCYINNQNKLQAPIGKRLSDKVLYILDSGMQPVPIGVSGEIYIGGIGIARGYLSRPELTAEKFIPNPFISKEEVLEGKSLRLYRTGDLARYLPDGNIEFVGRIDDQVKIRGFRIELGEIEAQLNQYEKVSQSIVLIREEEGHKQLVAYVVSKSTILATLGLAPVLNLSAEKSCNVLKGTGIAALTEELKNHLACNLPEYMVPTFFVFIDKVPLTSNGKVDKKVLPSPDLSIRQVGDKYVAPQTNLQQQLAAIWSDVLRIEKIGINDHFFSIGGDSIISIQLVSKARQQGIYLAVKDIFNHPTIAALSLMAKTEENTLSFKPEQSLVEGNIPLTPIQHWFFEQSFPNIHHYNQANLLQIKQVDIGLLQRSFELLITHHDVLRCRYCKDTEGTWRQNNLSKEDINPIWSIVNLSKVEDTQLGLRIEQEANILQQGLNIEKGPLIKVALFNCGERAARLLIVIHHLVVDVVSWHILLEDLELVYQALQNNKTPKLTKTHSFQQWSYALENYAKSEAFKPQMAYWREIENSIKPLPIDFDKGAVNALNTITISLNEEETTALLQKAPKAYRTQINDLLLTALTLAIGDWTKDYSLSLSLEGHGREDVVPAVDLSRTLGWFTSIFPVYLRIDNPQYLGEAIKTVKETLRKIPHKGIGYGIAQYLSLNNAIKIGVEPSLSFNYLGQWDNTLSQQGFFGFAKEYVGNSIATENPIPYLLNVNGEVRGGKLCFAWSYSINHYHLSTIDKIARGFVQRLAQIIQHCCQNNVFGYTPSDFDLITISQAKLDASFGAIASLEAIYPLSPIQAGFLFQAFYAPNSDAYFVQILLELEGELQINTFKQAWLKLLERHDSLRASFMWDDLEEPVQIIHKKVSFTWHEEDWCELSAEEQTKQLDVYIAKDRAQGFDFTEAPLMRWGLFKYDNDKHYLLWSHHHILSDGWSGPIILDEVRSIYDSLVNGKEISLSNRRPYGDYIAWLSKQDQKKAEGYWEQILEGITPTKLVSRDIKEDQTLAFGECTLALNEEGSRRLLRYAGELGVTPNTVLQTLWGIVLSVYTGQSDVVFGVTVSGRQIDLPGIESMVGIFINTLPLRIQLRGFESLEEAIQNTQSQMVGMQEHTYVPLWKIQAQQKEGGSGLFDSTYVYQNYPIQNDAGQSSGLTINLIRGIEKGEYKLGITLSYENCLSARINYSEACFTQDFIKQLLTHFEQLILNVINNPSQKIGELSLLKAEELNQLAFWNETQHEYPKDKSIHRLFEASVERVPDAIAIVYEDQHISYSALNERANQLAHYLRDLGVEAEVPVVLAIDRSIEMIIGILGILKAGGTYVPLEVNYPQERLEYMLEDSGAPFIVSRSRELEKLSIGHQIVIDLDEISKSLEEQPKTLPKYGLFSENLAYIIYTSGSTGRPKGVGVSHGSAVHLALAQQKAFSYNSNTKTLQFASISFDASVSEWGCTFAEGSTLIVCDNKDLTEVEKIIDKQQINLMTIPPSVLKSMSSEIISKHSKQIVVAGEAPDLSLIKSYQKNCIKVINAYGPTEGTVCSSLGVIESTNHIGRPIWNTKMHILDKYLNPIPVGVAGEIYIGGVGLARGYLNQSGLTAERFIPNPFEVGSRLYKTGDLGRYLPDGNIEFLGRVDHQVKLRGFRIELGEIEGTIEASGAVQQAVVLCREDVQWQKRLVAYVVPKNKEDNGLVGSLQNLCQSRLPDYMQPSQWVVLESLPLTPNGKIDRNALQNREDQFKVKESRLPRNSIEGALSEIFKELLNLSQIGVENNFFEMGGNSLLAVSLILNIKKELGLKVKVIEIFENPTVSSLANVILCSNYSELDSKLNGADPLFIIQSDGKQQPLFLIHPGVGLSLPYLPLKQFINDRPIIGIDDPYIGEDISGFKNLQDMASFYIQIIKKIQKTGPYHLAGWSFGGMVAFEMAQQMEENLDALGSLILIEAANPMLVESMIFNDENAKLEFEQKIDRNILLARTFRPKNINTRLSLIKAQSAFNELSPESYKLFQDSKYGWDKYCSKIIEYTIPGEHAAIFDKENITQIGNILKFLLE